MRRVILLLLFLPTPTLAGTWTPPEGCTAYLTVQAKQCRVSHHYTCTGDAPGDQWRVDMDQEGPFFYSRIDREGQWLQSYDPTLQTLDPNPVDPASFSTLLAEGVDTWDFTLSKTDGTGSRAVGFDRLTGKTAVIDGITLQLTEVDFTEYDRSGAVLQRTRGTEYISADWRLFFAGPSETEIDGEWLAVDGSPVEFIFPGEPGFLASQPIFDCDALTASLSPDMREILP
ncbi:MAG: hypothetical protein B7Z10_09815 [Rhodobacterales bacterium 32-66-7]|nr:MAG: hypothetical protein B7Z10_09815 [Rhodobacterales bacterium 32-66-7]